jgi:hypothetical protein
MCSVFPRFFAVMRIILFEDNFLFCFVNVGWITPKKHFKLLTLKGDCYVWYKPSSLISLSLVVHEPLTEAEQLRVRPAQDISEY